MGSVGDCYDNAVIESFWSRMQVELLDRQRWRTRVEPANAIFEYLGDLPARTLRAWHAHTRRVRSSASTDISSMNSNQPAPPIPGVSASINPRGASHFASGSYALSGSAASGLVLSGSLRASHAARLRSDLAIRSSRDPWSSVG